ncbi:hypothetical protein KIPB_002557 [Kipferlia bialata]|uniref:SRP54-type proteins GTP-binding domain-containing protein n=1 Tax=Kipferlia bialata TaxID=797122 RepID=A0A9K3CSE3_9EUKA|nr:hypothetical protein KIPB_002557 [Kipferlia bialata]|eukprot:g2557.t1
MREHKFELIIVDTEGRHRQEETLFAQMEEISAAIQPDETIFTLDSTIGQSAMEQARAFKDRVSIGSVIITKLDGHAKGGGAISAVAATDAPITFIGTGEQFEAFEPFRAASFVSRLLGQGDISGLMDMMQPLASQPEVMKQQAESMERMLKGQFSYRDFKGQVQMLLSLGPLDKMMESIPGMAGMMKQGGQAALASMDMRKWTVIMDSMTEAELDNASLVNNAKVQERLALGAGVMLDDVEQLVTNSRTLAKAFEGMGQMMGGGGKGNNGMMQAMQQMMGGMGGGMPGMGGPGGMGGMDMGAAMKAMMGGMGGRGGGGRGMGGMNMSKMMQMAQQMQSSGMGSMMKRK